MENKRPFIDHLIIEVFGVPFKLNQFKNSDEKLKEFINKCNLNVVKEEGHDFSQFGFTRIFILSESHIIFHSWPDYKYLHIDLMSCNKRISDSKIKKIAKEVFGSENLHINKIKYQK